jgi:hypothetical protein
MNEPIKFLKNLSPNKWATKVNDHWTIKDVVAHLIGWDEEAVRVIPEVLVSDKDPWFLNVGNYDEFNKKSVLKYEKLRPNELLNKLQEVENILNKVIEKYGAENLKHRSGFKWMFEENEESHSMHHLRQIKKALGEN